MKRLVVFIALFFWSLIASAALSDAQLQTLRTDILNSADADVIAARSTRNDNELARLYNLATTFIVWKSSAATMDMAKVINYIAVAAMTTANTDRIQLFVRLNPSSFDPGRADIRQFFTDAFSGALNGEGANTRAALDAFYRRAATRVERLFATGTGTTVSPGTLVFEGQVTVNEISLVLNQ